MNLGKGGALFTCTYSQFIVLYISYIQHDTVSMCHSRFWFANQNQGTVYRTQ